MSCHRHVLGAFLLGALFAQNRVKQTTHAWDRLTKRERYMWHLWLTEHIPYREPLIEPQTTSRLQLVACSLANIVYLCFKSIYHLEGVIFYITRANGQIITSKIFMQLIHLHNFICVVSKHHSLTTHAHFDRVIWSNLSNKQTSSTDMNGNSVELCLGLVNSSTSSSLARSFFLSRTCQN